MRPCFLADPASLAWRLLQKLKQPAADSPFALFSRPVRTVPDSLVTTNPKTKAAWYVGLVNRNEVEAAVMGKFKSGRLKFRKFPPSPPVLLAPAASPPLPTSPLLPSPLLPVCFEPAC